MSTCDLILDLGSHSIKLYRRHKEVEQIDVLTWELLEKETSEIHFETHLQNLLSKWKVSGSRTHAIGTEAMRRNKSTEQSASKACRALGIKYRTISQSEEAKMIHRAVRKENIPEYLYIINLGGGSIQIISGMDERKYLLPFGVSDLNKKFSLLEPPHLRKTDACIEWIKAQLPQDLKSFAYTGGERTYLSHLGVKLHNEYCDTESFITLAQSLAAFETDDLETLSPFDPKWMRGAIASNCVVVACLEISKAPHFLPSDLNISHGIIGAL